MREFTDRIYADFSGDDGDPRKLGASRYICMAWVLSREEDIWHNQGIVLKMKKIIGCRKDAELKYTSLKRHPHKEEALDLIPQAKIQVVLIPVLKDRLTDDELKEPKTKKLISLIHYFPLVRFLEEFARSHRDVYFQLVFDEITWIECRNEIRKFFKGDRRLNWKRARPDWLRFAKSGGNLMLQLADVIAGLGQEYIDSLEQSKLPPCIVCWVKGRCRCILKSVGRRELLALLYPLLLKNNAGVSWECGFMVRPPGACREFMFVDCLFHPELRKKRSSGRVLSSQPKPAS